MKTNRSFRRLYETPAEYRARRARESSDWVLRRFRMMLRPLCAV